jgi:DNA polymerase I
MYDLDLGGCIRVSGKEVQNSKYSTDLVVDAERIETIEPFKPPLKIFSFDIENSIRDKNILTICCAISDGETLTHESLVGDESASP